MIEVEFVDGGKRSWVDVDLPTSQNGVRVKATPKDIRAKTKVG